MNVSWAKNAGYILEDGVTNNKENEKTGHWSAQAYGGSTSACLERAGM